MSPILFGALGKILAILDPELLQQGRLSDLTKSNATAISSRKLMSPVTCTAPVYTKTTFFCAAGPSVELIAP